jgi:hypothetical protein
MTIDLDALTSARECFVGDSRVDQVPEAVNAAPQVGSRDESVLPGAWPDPVRP